MKIKLLYFDLFLPYLLNNDTITVGGTAVEWKNWFHGFLKNGVDIELLTWKGAKKYIKKKYDIQIRESYDLNQGIKILRVIYYIIPALYKSIKKSEATHIIQQNGSWIAGVLAIITKLQRKQFILRIASDSDVNIWSSNTLHFKHKIGLWIAIKLSDFIFCQNSYQYYLLLKKYRHKAIHILYNPIIISNKKQYRSKNRSYVSWIGRFAPEKNLSALVKIAKFFPDINFKIVGQTTSSTRKIDLHNIKELKNLKNVEIIDFIKRENILEFLNNSLMLLNTSNYEGLSNTFLEAWLVGTPIVTTVKVNPDNLIRKNNLGFVVETHIEMANHIKRIRKSYDYKSFYDRSNTFVKQNFDSIDQASKFITYLHK